MAYLTVCWRFSTVPAFAFCRRLSRGLRVSYKYFRWPSTFVAPAWPAQETLSTRDCEIAFVRLDSVISIHFGDHALTVDCVIYTQNLVIILWGTLKSRLYWLRGEQ